jgi:hypothetical protein
MLNEKRVAISGVHGIQQLTFVIQSDGFGGMMSRL